MASEPETTALQVDLPVQLLAEMNALIQAGCFRSLDEIVHEALRRYLDSHRDPQMEALLREDVEWGLRGKD